MQGFFFASPKEPFQREPLKTEDLNCLGVACVSFRISRRNAVVSE
jgi:hypothetical protein